MMKAIKFLPLLFCVYALAACSDQGFSIHEGKEWVSLGMGWYSDDILGCFSNVQNSGVSREVEILRGTQDSMRNIYCMVDLYNAEFCSRIFGVDMRDVCTPEVENIYFKIEEDNRVYFAQQPIGFVTGDGKVWGISSTAAMGVGTPYGEFDPQTGVCTFPAYGIVLFPYGNIQEGGYVNPNRLTRIQLPGWRH